jgi:hypothetical protein
MFEQKTVHIRKQKIPFDTLEPLVSVMDFQFTKKTHKLCRGPLPSMVPIGQVTDILNIYGRGGGMWSDDTMSHDHLQGEQPMIIHV